MLETVSRGAEGGREITQPTFRSKANGRIEVFLQIEEFVWFICWVCFFLSFLSLSNVMIREWKEKLTNLSYCLNNVLEEPRIGQCTK